MIKEIFDIENYKGAYVMHCNTEEKANIFLKYLDSVGETWESGCSYINNANWRDFKADTCYAFNKGEYCDLNFYRSHGFEILEFDDFYWGEENSPKEDSIQEALQKVEDAKQKEAHEFLKKGPMVKHPKHYQGNKFEVIDIIEDFDLNFSLGSAVKYILRAGKKDDRNQDLEKAIWYLQRELENGKD